jgi:hypothetical protein
MRDDALKMRACRRRTAHAAGVVLGLGVSMAASGALGQTQHQNQPQTLRQTLRQATAQSMQPEQVHGPVQGGVVQTAPIESSIGAALGHGAARTHDREALRRDLIEFNRTNAAIPIREPSVAPRR